MRAKKDKAPLRNFHLLRIADDELVRQSRDSGRNMTTVVEDLLLNRRQSGLPIKESVAETASVGLPERLAVDEAGARAMLSHDKRTPEAARKAFWRFRRMHNIKTLPGGLYSVSALRRACT